MRQDTLTLQTKALEQINAIKANDESMLKALYNDNYYKVEKYVLTNNGSEDQAKDIFQEAFIAVWRNIQLDKFTPANESSLAGYIYQVARNKWLDHLRKGQTARVVTIESVRNEMPQQEIASALSISRNMVTQHFNRAVAAITQQWQIYLV